MLFLGILSIQCKIRRDRRTETRRLTGAIDMLAPPALEGSHTNVQTSEKLNNVLE